MSDTTNELSTLKVLLDVQAWVEHWDKDRKAGLTPSDFSMGRMKDLLARAIAQVEGK